jgi:hypothetical protein
MIVGIRYHCVQCSASYCTLDYNKIVSEHDPNHIFLRLRSIFAIINDWDFTTVTDDELWYEPLTQRDSTNVKSDLGILRAESRASNLSVSQKSIRSSQGSLREYGAESLKCDSRDSIQISETSYGEPASDALFGNDEPESSNELLALHETGYAEDLPTIVDEQKVSAPNSSIAKKIQLFEELAKKPQEINIKGPFGRQTTKFVDIVVKPAASSSDVPVLDSSDSESSDNEQINTTCYVDEIGNEISFDDTPPRTASSYLNSLVPDLDAVSDFEEKKNSFFPNMAGISLRNQIEDVVGFYMTGVSDETSTTFKDMTSLKGKAELVSETASENEFRCQDLWDSYDQYLAAKSADTRFKALVEFRSNLQLFFAKSERYAKTIVDEIHLPYSEKSIRPVDAGGVAGGVKYAHDGIFFKFAVDLYDIFGGDRNAAKTAGWELKGLQVYFDSQVEGLRVPFMFLFDYRGFRMTVMPQLPINANTLKYGSSDAGLTIVKSDKELNKKMKDAALKGNLKGHYVGQNTAGKIYGPGDIEGHAGKDGHFYVIDTARVLPPLPPKSKFNAFWIPHDTDVNGTKEWERLAPMKSIKLELRDWKSRVKHRLLKSYKLTNEEYLDTELVEEFFTFGSIFYVPKEMQATPVLNRIASVSCQRPIYGNAIMVHTPGLKGKVLYNLMRPELLKQSPTALSSDAFTMFQIPGIEKENDEKDIRGLYHKLKKEIIPQFCEKLKSGEITVRNGEQLCRAMHEHGINLRFLGKIRKQFFDQRHHPLFKIIGLEICSRTTKGFLKGILRRIKPSQLDKNCINTIISYFNLNLSNGVACNLYWKWVLKPLLVFKFGDCLTPEEHDSHCDVRSTFFGYDKLAFFAKLQQQVGVKFSDKTVARFIEDPTRFETKWPLTINDFEAVNSRTKQFFTEFIDRELDSLSQELRNNMMA